MNGLYVNSVLTGYNSRESENTFEFILIRTHKYFRTCVFLNNKNVYGSCCKDFYVRHLRTVRGSSSPNTPILIKILFWFNKKRQKWEKESRHTISKSFQWNITL